jgi:pimeloyl-ACP methyl ester carboxylesterase
LIGESFGSQFAWQLIAGNLPGAETQQENSRRRRFKVDGLVLAGGFVKHPWKWGPKLFRWIGRKTPMNTYRIELKIYSWYSRFRHRHMPETLDSIKEFVERRTELDRLAMRHRLVLLDEYDPRPVARQARVPVHYLAGLVDPLVPFPLVRWWLRRNCPGYRGGKTFWLADHNVLTTAPGRAAEVVLGWMMQAS